MWRLQAASLLIHTPRPLHKNYWYLWHTCTTIVPTQLTLSGSHDEGRVLNAVPPRGRNGQTRLSGSNDEEEVDDGFAMGVPAISTDGHTVLHAGKNRSIFENIEGVGVAAEDQNGDYHQPQGMQRASEGVAEAQDWSRTRHLRSTEILHESDANAYVDDTILATQWPADLELEGASGTNAPTPARSPGGIAPDIARFGASDGETGRGLGSMRRFVERKGEWGRSTRQRTRELLRDDSTPMHMLDSALPSHDGTGSEQGRPGYEQFVDNGLLNVSNDDEDESTENTDYLDITERTGPHASSRLTAQFFA